MAASGQFLCSLENFLKFDSIQLLYFVLAIKLTAGENVEKIFLLIFKKL
jgi:hypothetical protein